MLTLQEKICRLLVLKTLFLSSSPPYPHLNRAYKNQSLPRQRGPWILGQNKRTKSQKGHVLNRHRQEQNLKTKRLEFLGSQLLQLLQFSGWGGLHALRACWGGVRQPSTGGAGAGPDGPEWGGGGRGQTGLSWAGPGGQSSAGSAGDLNVLSAQEPARGLSCTGAFSAGTCN